MIIACRNTCYILDQMIEMGFSVDKGIAVLQSAFKEVFIVSRVIYISVLWSYTDYEGNVYMYKHRQTP